MSRHSFRALAAVGALAGLTATASAGIVPALELDIDVSDGTDLSLTPTGNDIGGGLFNYVGGVSNANFELDWSLVASPNPFNGMDGAFVTNGFTIQNLSDETLEFQIEIVLPIDAAVAMADFAGSVGLQLTGTDATVATLPGPPIWEAFIDGASQQSLFDDPYSLGFSGNGAANDDADFQGTGASANSTIGIALAFSLTPGDTLGVTGAFGIIPGPAGLGLLAVAGLAGHRRRRD